MFKELNRLIFVVMLGGLAWGDVKHRQERKKAIQATGIDPGPRPNTIGDSWALTALVIGGIIFIVVFYIVYNLALNLGTYQPT